MNLDKKRWIILAAACLINLCLGSIYAWSVFASSMAEHFSNALGQNVTSGDLAINQKNRSNRFERNRSIPAIYNNRNNRRQNHGTHSIYSSRNAAYQTTFIRKIFHTRRDGCPIGHSKSQSGYQTIADD